VDHDVRRRRLAAWLPELHADGILVTRLPNVRYLTGFTGSNGQLLLQEGGDAVLFTDGRYGEQARHEVPDLPSQTYLDGFHDALLEACRRARVARLGFEAEGVTFRFHQEFTERAPDLELVPTVGEVERLRVVKDADELRAIERAQEITDEAFDRVVDRLREGMTERELALELEAAMFEAGAEGSSFPTIVAFGENAAEPHHTPTARPLGRGDVVKTDFGALADGYHADMTRTVAFGRPAGELQEIHALVRRAQEAGIRSVRAGAACGDVDAAARTVIEDAGYGQAFPHPLGHGVGLEIHEGPRLRRANPEPLPAGAVVTVEPGVYVPGLGGVRIEDMVEVTGGQPRVLPRSRRELVRSE
jgi:Xaa-Pro aminopeptidase